MLLYSIVHGVIHRYSVVEARPALKEPTLPRRVKWVLLGRDSPRRRCTPFLTLTTIQPCPWWIFAVMLDLRACRSWPRVWWPAPQPPGLGRGLQGLPSHQSTPGNKPGPGEITAEWSYQFHERKLSKWLKTIRAQRSSFTIILASEPVPYSDAPNVPPFSYFKAFRKKKEWPSMIHKIKLYIAGKD